ncbi:usherin [Polyodon spathula]|uniref:usherin n=1 Tax=Polyodon spathula TaxID=7913 RepID=UPI001B7F0321|nr:usherin [Polyodon spathula]
MAIIIYLRLLYQEEPFLSRMNCPLLQKGAVLLFYTIACYISANQVHPQGHFPRLENIGAYKNVTTVPTQSTCGSPERNAFCQSTVAMESLQSCTQQFCIQECAYRSATASSADLFSAGIGTCITEDKNDVHPGSLNNSTSFIFRNQRDCFVEPSFHNVGLGSSFTLTVWLKPEQLGLMTVIEKSVNRQVIFKLAISEEETQFHYNSLSGLQPPLKVKTLGRIPSDQWTHLALQVHCTRLSFFINGLEGDNTAFDTQLLAGPVVDVTTNAAVRIGQNSNGSDQFIGRMQGFHLYYTALTNREIYEVFSGKLPHLHTQTECRCPSSHPRVHPLVQRYCIPNGADDTTNDRVLRLNLDAHPLNYINDNDIGTSWISSVFTNLTQLDNGVTITFDLLNGEYQVFYVILQFLSPQPEAVQIQRKKSSSSEWIDWQYLARNCSIFGMENNGPLEKPDSVNCLQLPSNVPYSRGNVTFSVLTPEPNRRPGYNDFYNTPTLQEFVKATHIRIHLRGQYHTTQASVNFRHRYYGVDEITISGRCNCHGHAAHCDTSLNPYRCSCLAESHTEGDNCNRCMPLFNDKPFNRGDQVRAYNCKPCQCYNHATSCHYNSSLDPFPNEHFRGGGGVCDNCQHNTTGRNCELCRHFFFRELDVALSAIDVCNPCDCYGAGVINGSLLCNGIGGQCKCKRHVSGRQCNQCQHGFYNLQHLDPDGCSPCNCNTSGTLNGDITCHQNSGQCKCKTNAIGLTCDRCNFGFKFLSSTNPDGCEPCRCNRNGSLHQFCHPFTGQCECRERVGGLLCDTCSENFYGLNASGSCWPCDCNLAGTVPGTVCDAWTGQCFCKPSAGGRRCDTCLDGYHSLQHSNSLGCLYCSCDTAGTVNGSTVCDKSTGQCPCKTSTRELQCNQCAHNSYNLSFSNHQGCQPCDCDHTGTVVGTVCDQISGQCVCLPTRQGRSCNLCKSGFYLPPPNETGCLPCDCHSVGSIHKICSGGTGHCICKDASLTGWRCDQCKELFFGFNSGTGRCRECDCDSAGSFNGTCHPITGQCFCKQFVTGLKCNACVPEASQLKANNHLGCSKSNPSQQPPPTAQIVSSTFISLFWRPPDSPNTNILKYRLYREDAEIYAVEDQYPFGSKVFNDTELSPYTVYSYYIVASNVHGLTRSSTVSYRTMSGIPIGDLHLNLIGSAGSQTASFNWTSSLNTSGPIEKYVLSSITLGDPEARVHYQGHQTSVNVTELAPFTRYNFSLKACTSGGCAEGRPITFLTAQIPPEGQAPPRIKNISSAELYVEWDPPVEPNGIIIRYELYMQGPIELGQNHILSERRVFYDSGWFNPQPVVSSANENALMPPQTNTTVRNLEPFAMYRFRVYAVNMAGSTHSEWVSGRTGEAAPVCMPPPIIYPLNSSSLNVTWIKPSDNATRGLVTEYFINIHEEQTSNQFAPPLVSKVLHKASPHEQAYKVTGLKPYRTYNFTITLCNQLGCITSLPASGQTLAAAPARIRAPQLEGLNMTVIKISWDPPKEVNGPPPLYQLERMDTSLTSSLSPVMRGTRFPGHGYYRFPNSTLPVNTYFTGIKLRFRTREHEGLILFAVSAGSQEEYIALQIHNGRPYFLFDPQASAVAVSPLNDGGKLYNDNQWHHVIAKRNQAVGTIIVDNQYRGTVSATSGSTIIGENTGVFLGGLPKGFLLLRDDIGDAKLVERGFLGCISDVYVKKSDTPSEVWELLDWEQAEEKAGIYHSWEGCPKNFMEGAHFLGQGFLELHSFVFSGGTEFEISFEFRTDQLNGLLLFAFNKEEHVYLAAELRSGTLSFMFKTSQDFTRVDLWLGLSYCEGRWNRVTLRKQGSVATASMNKLTEQVSGTVAEELNINSPIYLGGIPAEMQSSFRGLGLQQGFGGCIKDVKFTQGAVVNLAAVSSNAVRVNLDGCLSTDTTVNCRGNDSILVYAGEDRSVQDHHLQTFSEYLYRVVASNDGGSTSSPWERGRTREAVPQSVPTPSRVCSVNGYSVEVSWDEPAGVRGVIEKYVLKAYNEDSPSMPPITAEFTSTHSLTGNLTGLVPFTNYSITLTACTLAGCTESLSAWNISTPQEAPSDVEPPAADSHPYSLCLFWHAPHQPNGIITEYTLHSDNMLIYKGNQTQYNITGLGVYTPHWFVLTACTINGCTNSSQVTLFTAQLPPTHVDSPIPTVLDSRSIYMQWRAPMKINGVLERYLLYISTMEHEFGDRNIVYNSSELFHDYTVHHLTPGTNYFMRLAACSGGGCTVSEPIMARTEESTPENVPAPNAQSFLSDSFNISWTEPERPNGIITSYGLYMNGVLVQNSSNLDFHVSGLAPWSLHTFRVQACTAKGCALGLLVEARTLEAAPVGTVALEMSVEGPRSVRAKWMTPAKPNGLLTYSVLFTGLFYADQAKNYSTKNDIRSLYSSKEVDVWVSIGGLVPFSNYTVQVNACNSQGCVMSSPKAITLPPGAPDGVLPPRLSSATPTSLQVVWSAPVRNNAPGFPSYQLHMKHVHSTGEILEFLFNASSSFSYTAEGLKPYTAYEFRLIVLHVYGNTVSDWAQMVTAEDKPGAVDPPLILEVKPRSVSITWQHPSQPNGKITGYNIYQNEVLKVTVASNSTSYIVTGLEPYTEYRFQVESCTSVGCSLSLYSNIVQTPPGPPEDIPPPQLYSETPTSVILAWQPPLRPNGVVKNFTVERRVKDTRQVSKVVTVQANDPLSYLDHSTTLSPWTTYEYRIVVSILNGGSNSSEWKEVTTRPSRPAGLEQPKVLVLGSDSVMVTWSPPLIPHGEILCYEIRMPDPHITITNTSELSYTVINLVPYTNYTVTVLACSGGGGHTGGCTESLPTSVTTLPTIPQGLSPLSVTIVSESFLVASWQPPSRPNGPNLRYELLRRKIWQPLASSPIEDLNRWYNIYSGDKLFYEDKGLSRYTAYDYKLLVHNDVGFASGDEVSSTTQAGIPIKGSTLMAKPLNHTAIQVDWTRPSLQDLQGVVEHYILFINSSIYNHSATFPAHVNCTIIGDLRPNTEYGFFIQVFNGAHRATSEVIRATTSDGEPEGVFPPKVVTLNSTAVRVIWTSPSNPNGVVTEYSVYVNDKQHKTGMSSSGSFVLGGLLPFTIYNIQVEVCTMYACVKSNGTQITTVEDEPSDMVAPNVHVISSRSVRVDWASPGRPNGIILGYDVRRRILRWCAQVQLLQEMQTGRQCLYVQCGINENICGGFCYQPEHQICCSGVLYSSEPGYRCCEDKYIPVNGNSTAVCCGGQLYTPQPNYECCGGYYVKVVPGYVCCPNSDQIRVSVGVGSSCCSGNPYSRSGDQICCAGTLHDGFHKQCCGGQVVSKDLICCGNEEKGSVHKEFQGMSCCGEQYVNLSNTICCTDISGVSRPHFKENETISVKCCGTEIIPTMDECCNGVGYNPLKYVCADKPSPGITLQKDCSPSILCPISMAAGAFCGKCEFNPATHICTWVEGSPSAVPNEAGQQGLCPSPEETVYTGGPNRYTFKDTDLDPHVTYEYRVAAWNSYSQGFSDFGSATTEQDVPQGVGPPKWSKVDNREDIIQLNWKPPAQPNGIIIHYIILRDGSERFRGTEYSFTDTGGIQPYQEYFYQLRVCTVVGCTDSSKVVAVTVQGVPENVHPPTVTALGPTDLQLSWRVPAKPNGIIKEYQVIQTGRGLIYTDGAGRMQCTVTGLQPHTNYSFMVKACTSAGCSASQPSIGRTLQAAPQGVWSGPRHVVVSSDVVELYWNEPSKPNGIISQYRLMRDGMAISTADRGNLNYTDTGLQPNTRYVYVLEASTGGGSNRSEKYVIQTPVATPERIPVPHNVTGVGPRSVFVAWTPPGVFNTTMLLEYNILLNIGSNQALIRAAGHDQFLLVEGLRPFTQYEIRIQACQQDGCGVGPRAYIKTDEAPPEDIKAPTVTASGSSVIEVRWAPPREPNGVITNYFIHRRPVGTQDELLVFIWSEGALEFIDASDILQPHTEYEYRVRARNTRGSVDSLWSSTQTLEALPQGMAAPSVQPTSAYSVFLNWTEPASPNGIIAQYRVVYQKRSSDPTFNTSPVTAVTVPGTNNQAHVFGLEPFTTYNIHVVAVNSAGQVTSPWTSVRTLEASPSGLNNFTVEKRENGRALLLKWSEPLEPNGVIKTYNIFSDDNLEFSGLSRQFHFRRLEPYTVYTLVLEACTSAGCTRSASQPIRTDEAPPSSQPAPVAQSVNTTSIELTWAQPTHPNGKISEYQIIVRNNQGSRLGNAEVLMQEEKILFTEYSTEKDTFLYNVTDLKAWTKYEFKIRSWNTAGYTDSSWIMVETKQAQPKGLAAPRVHHLEDNPHNLFITWTPPEEINGVLQYYRLQRDNITFPFSFDTATVNYTDEDLMAYTMYSYAIIACTMGGCTTSLPATIRTLETAPSSVGLPKLITISATEINVSWSAPLIQNGEITKYTLLTNGEQRYTGKGLFSLISSLQPYTEYQFILIVCTNGGCTSSPPASARTHEAPPTNMRAPRLKVTGSESVEVTWEQPTYPNGEVKSYELRRDGDLIYVGLETRYHDFTLMPGIEYTYTVTANNIKGSITSPIARARTNPSAPSGVSPPKLQPSSLSDIFVMWDPPARSNGEIMNYTVFRRDPAEAKIITITFPSYHPSYFSRSYTLSGLKPYYRYEVRIEACTVLGCASSDWASTQTLEAPPANQTAPLIELHTDSDGFQSVLLVSWPMPQQPNGKILYFELYRRQVTNPPTSSGLVLIYKDVLTSFRDATLQPFTEYEYQVWSINSVGKVSSSWSRARTGPAPPEGVPPPTFPTVQATSAVVSINPPTKPNGIVSLYRVFANSTDKQLLLSEGTSIQQIIHGLQPFTNYSVGVEACTCFQCCSRGPVAQLMTQPSAPSNQPLPRVSNVTSRSATVEWNEPQSPNGIIESYELQMYTACPQPGQPLLKPCAPGPHEMKYSGKGRSYKLTDLQPYTSYNLRVMSYNSVGSTGSEWLFITTQKEMPQYRAPFIVISNLTTVYLDWSYSFILNGQLREYALTENGVRLYSGFDSTLHIPRTSDKTFVFQVTCTTDTGSVSTPIIKYNTATGIGPVETAPGEKTGIQDSDSKFYTELWFIILMAILGLIFLAIILAVVLQRAISKPPFERERPPIVPLQQRMPSMSVYPPSDAYVKSPCSDNPSNQFPKATILQVPVVSTSQAEQPADTGLADTKIAGPGSHLSNRSMSVLRVPSQTQLSQVYSQNSLLRSVSQLIDIHDKKSLIEDVVWETIAQGHDSGMFVEDEDLIDSVKGFSTVRKEHTMFTDTHL